MEVKRDVTVTLVLTEAEAEALAVLSYQNEHGGYGIYSGTNKTFHSQLENIRLVGSRIDVDGNPRP